MSELSGEIIQAQRDRSQLAEVSAAMVRIYKELFGRGPTRTRTDFAGPDTLACVLEDTLTQAERSMLEIGAHERLRELRMFFQYSHEETFRAEIRLAAGGHEQMVLDARRAIQGVMRDEAVAMVEAATGRTVRAFMSDSTIEPDLAVEVFVLEPEAMP